MPDHSPNFNPLARPYRWLEYLTFGPCLERTRFHFLPQLAHHRHTLILGDGDGRFTARLLAANPEITIDAVDSSATMLRLLTERATRLGPSARQRLRTIHTNALNFTPEDQPPKTPTTGTQPTEPPPYDLIVTHFFLDCLTEPEIATLLHQIRPNLAPNATWLISEFAIPQTGPGNPLANRVLRPFAKLLIATLYRAFQLLTGLKTRALPDYPTQFRNSGFALQRQKSLLGGILTAQLWHLDPPL